MQTKHMALHVPDLQHAEEYDQHVFDLDVVTREALTNGSLTDDERWAQLPHTATWGDARLAGLESSWGAPPRRPAPGPLPRRPPARDGVDHRDQTEGHGTHAHIDDHAQESGVLTRTERIGRR